MQKKLLSKLLSKPILLRMAAVLLLIISTTTYAQSRSKGLYSFNWQNSTVSTVIRQIEDAAKVHFTYNPEDIDLKRKITLEVSNKDLEQVIGMVAKQISINYKIDGETIMIKAIKTQKGSEAFQLAGKVFDNDHLPLPGVSIANTTTQKSVSSGSEGNFVIEAHNGDVIVFKMLGFDPTTITASDKEKNLTITLKPNSTELKTVVVTALGIKREERALGYAYSEVDGNDLKKAREPNIINSLEGRVAGLVITGGAGGPAGSSRVIIRGNTSITGNNQPLYVVDGVPIDNSNYGQVGGGKYSGGQDFGDAISAINPDDVDKISVLKGPSASALYGSRAANGVILITTKKGGNKKELGIEYNSTSSIETQLTHEDGNQYIYGQGTGEQLVVAADQAKNTLFNNFGPRLDPNLQVIGFDGKYRPYALVKDNIQNFFRTGSTFTNTVAFSNSNDVTSFRLSASDMRNNDILPGSHMRRNSFNFSGSSKFGSKITMEARLMYMNEDVVNRPSLADDPGNIGNNFIGLANNVDQAYFKQGYQDVEGNYVDWGGGQYRLDPYWVINKMKNETTKNRVIAGATGNYNITSWLSLQGRASTDFTYFDYTKFSPISTPGSLTGELDDINQKLQTTEADLLLSVQKQVTPSLWLSARLGTSISRIDNPGTTGYNIDMTVTDVVSVNSFSDKTIVENRYRKQTNSIYGLFTAAYKSFLYLDATLRRDASSTLPVNNNTYTYPSLAGSFVFTDAFKIDKKILSFGKIRLSGAEVGNDTDPYQLNLYYNLYPQTFNGQSLGSIATTILPNKNLKPTRTTSFEAGTELKFFTDRLGLDFTYYTSKSKDQINVVALPFSSGFAQEIINAGVVDNKGVEIMLTGKPLAFKNFNWNVSVNFARNVNTVESLAAGVPYLTLSDARWLGVSVVAKPGAAYGSILGYGYQKDPNGNVILDPVTLAPVQSADRTVLGKGTWDWTGGITNSLYYKNFGLTFVIDIKHGSSLFSMTNLFDVIRGSSLATLPGRAEWIKSEEARQTAGMSAEQWAAAGKVQGYVPQGVVQTGTDAKGNPIYARNTKALDPSVYWANYYSDGNGIATPFIYDASYIKMREITASYQIPASLTSKWHIKDITVALVARNPFIIHKNVPNVDPDSNYNNGNGQGLEYGSLPQERAGVLTLI
ncbi:SusC/RagA family TonB-linked outer membrane protein [Mucilaginibacter sp. BJC16-A38]|uniref:SusC/RagA family TonB-linked outer membrane protein n=1 Tax=Mucilaginibacter phenanthrenivorans TaxID=1234842 RepID=UPI0021576B09|nr:SusC/RagA family TonB-linked outer membrane protein [Mucilaginibacter phenanthrenivorans]MCR8556700.1 SusC/RagA family TonB-linked outer membrane protein [Mucilaginibacter phenanthrenivorans]